MTTSPLEVVEGRRAAVGTALRAAPAPPRQTGRKAQPRALPLVPVAVLRLEATPRPAALAEASEAAVDAVRLRRPALPEGAAPGEGVAPALPPETP